MDDGQSPDALLSRRVFLSGAAAGVTALPLVIPAARMPRTRRGPRATLPDAAEVASVHGDPADLGVLEAAALLQARRLSSRELTEACLTRIRRRDPLINAWVRVYPDLALDLAEQADARLAGAAVRRSGPASALCGVPVGLKDLFAVAGRELTAGSRVLTGHIAPGDSTAYARLRGAGMPLLGHLQMAEFAFANDTPQTGNPYDPSRSPGGSSGGGGAALAARTVPAALGTDTAGSVRLPSSACNTSAIKPTVGRVSTHGVIPLLWSYDHVGPMARSVADCALLLSVMAGPDPRDPASLARSPASHYPTVARPGRTPLRGMRIGVLRVPDDPTLPPAIADVIERARGELAILGATLVPVTPPADTIDTAAAAALTVEIDLYHRQFFPTRADRYSPDVAERLAEYRAVALQALAVDYLRFQRQRAQYICAWNDVFEAERLDALVQTCVDHETPRRGGFGGWAVPTSAGETGPVEMWNKAGFPVVAVPAGMSAATGMPIGIQLVGRPDGEAGLLQLAIDYQERNPYHLQPPAGLP
ncbi:MAG TPA: amidase [Candidatus Dormibacteraeota bacterium]|nr:amidase [Candidatus Dormibacteraeota bacterium]